MITLHFSYWWLFLVALILILVFCQGDSIGSGLLILLLLIIFLVTVACKVAAHFGVL